LIHRDEVDLVPARAYALDSMAHGGEIGISFFGFLAARIFAR